MCGVLLLPKPVPYGACRLRRDSARIAGATLVVARLGTLHEFNTGRDKPVPYSARNSGIEHDSCSSHSTSTGIPQVTASASTPTTLESSLGPSSRSIHATT